MTGIPGVPSDETGFSFGRGSGKPSENGGFADKKSSTLRNNAKRGELFLSSYGYYFQEGPASEEC